MARGLDEPWIAAAELPEGLGREWARAWKDWFGARRVELARAPDKAWLARVESPLGPLVAKRSRPAGWKRSLLALGARRSRSERAYHLAEALRARGFRTPEPLAVLGLPRDSVLVMRHVAGSGPWEIVPARMTPVELVEALAAGIARLHGAGFRHRDLKASNFLFTEGTGRPELVWIDLDGLAWRGTVEPHVRARDLARLCTSFASCEARAAGVRADAWPELLRRYLEHALGRPPQEHELEQLLVRTRSWSDRNIRRHLATQRPVQ